MDGLTDGFYVVADPFRLAPMTHLIDQPVEDRVRDFIEDDPKMGMLVRWRLSGKKGLRQGVRRDGLPEAAVVSFTYGTKRLYLYQCTYTVSSIKP